jgi:hypothetical protein
MMSIKVGLFGRFVLAPRTVEMENADGGMEGWMDGALLP